MAAGLTRAVVVASLVWSVMAGFASFVCPNSKLHNTLRGHDEFDCGSAYVSSGKWNLREHKLVTLNFTSASTFTIIGYGFVNPTGYPLGMRQQLYDDEFGLLDNSICDTNYSSFAAAEQRVHVDEEATGTKASVQSAQATTNTVFTCYLYPQLVLNHGVYYLDNYFTALGNSTSDSSGTSVTYVSTTTGSSPSSLTASYSGSQWSGFVLLSGFIAPSSPPTPVQYPNGHSCSSSSSCSSTCCCSVSASNVCASPSGCSDLNGYCRL